jgi:hypothetical protein
LLMRINYATVVRDYVLENLWLCQIKP